MLSLTELPSTHLCHRTGEGLAISALGVTEDQLMMAVAMVIDCEGVNGPCPEECDLKKLAGTNDALNKYRQMFGGVW